MELEIDNWYYFDLMGHKYFISVYEEENGGYRTKQYFKKYLNEVKFDKKDRYIAKDSNILYSCNKISEKNLIKTIFT